MKKWIIAGGLLMGLFSAVASPIFEADFSGTFAEGTDPSEKATAWNGYGDATEASAVTPLGAPTMVTAGQWFGRDGAVSLDGSQMTLSFANDSKPWARAAGIVVNLDGYAAGAYTVSFNVTDLTTGGTGSANYFAYSATNLTSGAISMNSSSKSDFSTFNDMEASGTTWTEVQTAADIAATGLINYAFTLDRAGTAADAMILGWNVGTRGKAAGNAASITLSDVMIDAQAIPEPATMGLLGFGACGMLLLRRRLKRA